MKRPDLIWVGALPYTVAYDHDAIRITAADIRKDIVGHSQHHTLQITVNDDVAEQVIRDTLLHEVLHCIWNDAGMAGLEMTEEEIIGCLTPRLVSVLRVNPELIAYLVYSSDDQETLIEEDSNARPADIDKTEAT